MDLGPATAKAKRLTQAHEGKRNSKSEQEYSEAITGCIDEIKKILREAGLNDILSFELLLMQYDLERYTDDSQTKKNVLIGIEDFNAGLSDYQVLREDPVRYYERRYVRREMAGPDRMVPLDSMRKALNSHARRLESYASSPMVNDIERVFQKARFALVRKAERLYDAFQRSQKENLNS